jgi:hypothetical protein
MAGDARGEQCLGFLRDIAVTNIALAMIAFDLAWRGYMEVVLSAGDRVYRRAASRLMFPVMMEV